MTPQGLSANPRRSLKPIGVCRRTEVAGRNREFDLHWHQVRHRDQSCPVLLLKLRRSARRSSLNRIRSLTPRTIARDRGGGRFVSLMRRHLGRHRHADAMQMVAARCFCRRGCQCQAANKCAQNPHDAKNASARLCGNGRNDGHRNDS